MQYILTLEEYDNLVPKSERIETREAELINALYNMIVKLKEEEVI